MTRDDEEPDPETAGFIKHGNGASIADCPQYLNVNDKLAWMQGWRKAEMWSRERKDAAAEAPVPTDTTTNVVHLNTHDGRKETWNFPDGTTVTMTVPATEPPITVKHAVFCLSSMLHGIHRAMS